MDYPLTHLRIRVYNRDMKTTHTYNNFWELVDSARCSIDTFPATTAGDAALAERHETHIGHVQVEHVTALRLAYEADTANAQRFSRTITEVICEVINNETN